ncbi:hypothetical protein [Litchfieldia alkalitelluris]|uniref:hypothetical protein n=1 Tax=Litchfieldia alkalitelluris TaxID=304268 RepID=UPI000997807F|nr:hypothetical protein [Litchfieldia alkalitelluris]
MRQVLSIPAGETLQNIKAYHVHAYPHPRNYEKSQFVTFRAPRGGKMDMLYSIVEEIVLDPRKHNVEEDLTHLGDDARERILMYIQARKGTRFGFEREDRDYMFYVLKEEVPLSHTPRPKGKNTAGHTYYTYDEITSGKEEIVIESRM